MDNKPSPNRLDPDQDARHAASLLSWQKELECRFRNRDPDDLTQIDHNLQAQCEQDINLATDGSVLQVFTYQNGTLCLTT